MDMTRQPPGGSRQRRPGPPLLRPLLGLLLALALCLGRTGGAHASPVLHEPFDAAPVAGGTISGGDFVAGYSGQGWTSDKAQTDREAASVLRYPADGLINPQEGTFAFRLQRTVRTPEGRAVQTALSVADASGKALFSLALTWETADEKTDGATIITLYGEDFYRPGSPFDTTWVLDRQVPVGAWLHVLLNWSKEQGGYQLYVDGRRLTTRYNLDVQGAEDRQGAFNPAELTYFTGAAELVVGAETSARSAGGWSPLYTGVIDELSVYDRPITPADLGPDLEPVWALAHGVAASQTTYGAGQDIVVTLRGVPDLTARFTVDGVVADVAMAEVDDGVYAGRAVVPSGAAGNHPLRARVTSPNGETSQILEGGDLTFDTEAPAAVVAILADAPWPGEIEVSWDPSPAADVETYRVYRAEGQGTPPATGTPYDTVPAHSEEFIFVDTGVLAGLTYSYLVVPVDRAGNAGEASDSVWAEALAGDGPAIAAISLEPFGRPTRPGDEVTLHVSGQSGAAVTADVGELASAVPLAEDGRTGRYSASYTVPDGAMGSTRSLHRIVVHMVDDYGQSDQAGPELAVIGEDVLNDATAPTISGASHDGWQVAGFSGTLVAGDILTVTVEGEPGGYASFAIDGVVDAVAMSETSPGTYSGLYTVAWGDDITDAAVRATMADQAGNTTSSAVGQPLTIDTRVRLSVTARDGLLPADGATQTRLVARAEDANGDGVAGHELALTLSTTEEYTGVVGGGDIEGKEATKDDPEDVEVKWGGTSDSFGEVAATYTAGYAAKTALVLAKDLTTGDVGVGWLNTYVASTVVIELTEPRRALRGIADRAKLTLTVDRAELTADGRSTARLTATLTDFSDNPIADESIHFVLAGGNGKLKTLDRRTDDRGRAEAEYRAGTAAGTVTVTATSLEYAVSSAVQISLLSDAPAKIELVATAAELPADGRSTAQLQVRVSDIHDNPNRDVPVTFALLDGGDGELESAEVRTDSDGEGGTTYTAGREVGPVVIEARHTSRAPTEEELRRIQGTLFVPRLAERQERDRVKVAEWLVEAGDEVAKGQPLVELESRAGSWTLLSPEAGIFVREVKHRRDRVELGDTLGYVEVDIEVWEEEYVR